MRSVLVAPSAQPSHRRPRNRRLAPRHLRRLASSGVDPADRFRSGQRSKPLGTSELASVSLFSQHSLRHLLRCRDHVRTVVRRTRREATLAASNLDGHPRRRNPVLRLRRRRTADPPVLTPGVQPSPSRLQSPVCSAIAGGSMYHIPSSDISTMAHRIGWSRRPTCRLPRSKVRTLVRAGSWGCGLAGPYTSSPAAGYRDLVASVQSAHGLTWPTRLRGHLDGGRLVALRASS